MGGGWAGGRYECLCGGGVSVQCVCVRALATGKASGQAVVRGCRQCVPPVPAELQRTWDHSHLSRASRGTSLPHTVAREAEGTSLWRESQLPEPRSLYGALLLSLQPHQAASALPPPPTPHLHPPRSLGASDQFWLCPEGSGATPCSGRQDPSVSPTSCPLKAASRCPWRQQVKKSWPQQRPGSGVTGGHAQLLPARHTHTHSMARGAGGAKPWVCAPHTGRRASPRPGFRGSRAGTEGSGHVGTHT